MSRAHPDIDSAIARTEAKLQRLYAERGRRDRDNEIVAEFDAGKDMPAIAADRRLKRWVVQGILYRAGRTVSGRTAIRRRLRGGNVDQVAAP